MQSIHMHSRPVRQPRLYTAIANNDSARVSKYIQAGDSLSHPTKGVSDFTPLQHAVIDRNHSAIQSLQSLGADLNAENSFGMTAMHVAAVFGDDPVIQLLSRLGVSTRAVDAKENTPLHYAIFHKRQGLAVCLIRLDPGVIHLREECLSTPLMMACSKGLARVVRVLLEHGARCEAQGNLQGNNSLHQAAFRGSRRIMRLLLETEPYQHLRNNAMLTPLHVAMSCDWPGLCDMLVAAGGDPELEDSCGETALFYGCRFDDYYMVVASLDYNVDPLKPNKAGQMPIHVVCPQREKEFVHLLVRAMFQKLNHNHELVFFANYVDDRFGAICEKVYNVK